MGEAATHGGDPALKGCPWCGAAAVLTTWDAEYSALYVSVDVRHSAGCLAEEHSASFDEEVACELEDDPDAMEAAINETKARLAAAWNKRPEEDRLLRECDRLAAEAARRGDPPPPGKEPWVPVAERLPAEEGWYLGRHVDSDGVAHVDVGIFIPSSRSWLFRAADTITHWMPMPGTAVG